jgi:hypothetical protein
MSKFQSAMAERQRGCASLSGLETEGSLPAERRTQSSDDSAILAELMRREAEAAEEEADRVCGAMLRTMADTAYGEGAGRELRDALIALRRRRQPGTAGLKPVRAEGKDPAPRQAA